MLLLVNHLVLSSPDPLFSYKALPKCQGVLTPTTDEAKPRRMDRADGGSKTSNFPPHTLKQMDVSGLDLMDLRDVKLLLIWTV